MRRRKNKPLTIKNNAFKLITGYLMMRSYRTQQDQISFMEHVHHNSIGATRLLRTAILAKHVLFKFLLMKTRGSTLSEDNIVASIPRRQATGLKTTERASGAMRT